MDSLRRQLKRPAAQAIPLGPPKAPARPVSTAFELVPDRVSMPSVPRVSADTRRAVRKARWIAFGLLFLSGAIGYGWVAKQRAEIILRAGNAGYAQSISAAEAFKSKRFADAELGFRQASHEFADAHAALNIFPGWMVDSIRFIPGLSKAASGRNAILAGEHIVRAGISMSQLAIRVTEEPVPGHNPPSLLEKLEAAQVPLETAGGELALAKDFLARVNVADIPEARREKFVKARELLPEAAGALAVFEEREKIFVELLGGNGPRKYLFLFQNNHELRATGGFIGSYALLDLHDGVVEQFFVDGIFNPDGQLKENIVPPKPIQKISAGWSLHDSNWYPDFPTSAEKAIFFYEKTGGPTVDGVVTITPVVLERLLEVLGPIDLPEYGVTIDAKNFIPIVQEQVEEKYDRQENKPKKILSDLAVAMFARMGALDDPKLLVDMAEALVRGLNEKHVLLYARHAGTEELIDQAGWSGRLLSSDKDYLAVVHSNINGYKTDGVMDESIWHRSDIAPDGSIVDTLSITRRHRGGDTPYEWWNKVNADYLRVYVPLGAELLTVKGTTWEFPEDPLDYEALSFRRDADVVKEEADISIHQGSGTRIGTDGGKTVFGSWVYVSPGESVTVEMTYRLPFRLDTDRLRSGQAERFSVLYQKQSGSLGSQLQSEIVFPERWKSVWQTGGDLIPYGRKVTFEGDLAIDHFIGTALVRE